MSSQKQIRNLVKQVRDNLTPDLLKPGYGREDNPVAGHCYVATESLYHLLGGKESGWFPVRLRMPDSDVHWWLENSDGDVLDATHDQFNHEIPYDEGRPGGFLTREPSKRAQELMTRVKHNTMAESLPPDDVTASAENPQLVLERVELRGQYLSWKGELKPHVSAQDTIYNVIDQDPEYYQEYGTYKIVGSIDYVEFGYGKDDHELYVDQVYVDPEYRKTNAFWMLVKPVLDSGLPINATFMNKQLQRIFERLQSRGEIKVHPLYVGSRQSHVEVVDGPWSFHGGGYPFFFFPDDNMLFLMPHETYHIDLRHAMPLEYQQELRNYTKDDLDRVSYVAGRIDFVKESPDESPIPVVDVYRGSVDWQEIIEQIVVEGIANGDIPNDLSNDEFEKWVDSDEPTPEPETRGTLGEFYDLPEHPFEALGGYEQQKEAAMLVEELESKTSMAERTGDPTLDKLIDTFINTSSEELGDSPLHEWLTDPEEAQGMCSLVSAEFAQFIREQGFDAYDAGEDAGVDDDYYRTRWPERFDKNPMYQTEYTPNDWGYSDRTRTKGDEYYPQHSATIVHMPTGTFMVDFTSAQYGYKEFPMVQRLNDAGSWDRQWTSKTAKIVTLPDTLKLHDNGNDQRATFVYLVPTDTLYVAPNNAYHTDIWNWLYQHREEEYNQLFSRKFKDAFKEGVVALGLIERDWEDRALNCRLYWAEGNETLPPHIMDELSNYFGEKVYQRPWKYPQEPNINSPEYWYGPDEEEEPTQQYPTNSLEAKWKLSTPFDYRTVDWKKLTRDLVAMASQYGFEIFWDANMRIDESFTNIEGQFIKVKPIKDNPLAYAVALHEIGHVAFRQEYESKVINADDEYSKSTYEEEMWVNHWMLEHAEIPISPGALKILRLYLDSYEDAQTPAPGYGWMMQPKQSTYELDPQQIPALKKQVEQVAAENGIHVEWRDQPWFANTFLQGWNTITGERLDGVAYCADPKTDLDLATAMHEIAHGVFKETFDAKPGASSVEEELWVNHWAFEHSPIVFDQATLEKMKTNIDQYMNIHVHHPSRGVALESPANPGWLQNIDPDPYAPSADDMYTPEDWEAYDQYKKKQRQHYQNTYLPAHTGAIVRWVDANEPTGGDGYGGDDRFACIYDETTDMLYISTETDVVHRDLCRAIPEYAAAANGRKWLRALDFLDYGGIHIDPYHPDQSFWLSYHGEMPEDDMNKLLEICQASEYKKLQDELREAGSLMPYRYIILKDGTEINDAGDGSIGSHRDLAKRNGIRWKTVQDLGFYDPSEPTGRYGLKERARDRGKIYDERVRLWYEKAFDDDKPPQTLMSKTSVKLPGVEWVDTTGEYEHGDGLPFIYVPDHDALYVGTTQTGHRKLIKKNEDLNSFLHPEEYGAGRIPNGIIPGRVDYKGNAGFYQIGKPYAPEHVDRATELLQSAWPYMEGRDVFDRRRFEDDDYSFLRKLTKTSALIQVPAGKDLFADMGIAFLYWKGDLYYCQGHHPDIFSYVKRTDGRYFADQSAYKEMREDAKDGSAVFGWMTLHQGLWADSPAYKTHNGLLIFFSTGNMKAINMFTSQQTKDEAAALIDANDEVFLEMVSDKTDRPWLLESNSWLHPDDGRDKREFLPGGIRDSVAYALVNDQLYIAPGDYHRPIYEYLKDQGFSKDEMKQGLWGYYDLDEKELFEHTDSFEDYDKFWHKINMDKYLPTAIDVLKESHTAANRMMFHVAPTAARSSIAQYGLNWQRRDKRNDWRQDDDEELYPYGNYLTTSLEKAKEYQRIINGGGQIYQVDTTGLNLIRDVDEDYEGTAYYTTNPIEPSRITLLDHTSKVAFPDNLPEQLQITLAVNEEQWWVGGTSGTETSYKEPTATAMINGREIGYLTVGRFKEDFTRKFRRGEALEIKYVWVMPRYRRRGIALAMLNAFLEDGWNVQHSTDLSDQGKAWRDSLDMPNKQRYPKPANAEVQLRDMQQGDESPPYSNRLTNEQGIAAYVGDEQVGHVTYSIEPEGQYLHDRAPMSGDYPRADRDYTYVHWLYVEPEWRQQGISRILLDAVRERTGNPMRGDLQSEHVREVQDSKTAALFSKLVDWLQQRFYMSYEDAEAIASDMHGAGYADFLDPHEELLPLVYEIAEKYGIELHDPYDVDAPPNAAEQWKIDHKDDPRYTKTAAAEILIDTVSAYPSEGPVILDNNGIVWFGRGYSSHETLQGEIDKLGGGYEVARAEIIQDDYVPQPNLKGYPTPEQDDRMFNELRDAGVLIKRRLKDKSLTELYSGGFLNPQVEGNNSVTSMDGNVKIAAEGTLAFAYLPDTDQVLIGQDHPSMVIKQIAPLSGVPYDQVMQALDGYYNSDPEEVRRYYDFYEQAQEWAYDHVLFGWYGSSRRDVSMKPQLWSCTQGNSEYLLTQYGERALQRAAQQAQNLSLPQSQMSSQLAQTNALVKLNAAWMQGLPITSLAQSQGLSEAQQSLTHTSRYDKPEQTIVGNEWRRFLNPSVQAKKYLSALGGNTPRTDYPHQTGLPRVPPVVSGTSICPTETTWDFSSITSVGETEGELPLMSDEARNSLRAKLPGFKLVYVPTSDEESRYDWLWNNGAESYTTQKAVYFNPYLKMFCIGSPGYHHSDLMRGMRRDGITEARLTSEAREEGWIYGYIDGDDGPGLHGRGLENYLRTLPDTLDISSEGSASENVPEIEDNVRLSEVIDLNQFGDVRDVRTRYRAIAFASDGNNVYIGGNHPAILKAVLGNFKDKELIKNNWVFGWADRIGPDTKWVVDMTSGNYSWINSKHQEHLERTKRFMLQYLNGTHEAALFQDDTPQNDAISEAIPQLAEHLNAHGYKQQDFAYCVMPDGTAYISMGDIATHQDMMKFFKHEQGYTTADFKQWRWGYITVYNTNQGTIDSGSWSIPTKVRTPATSFQFLSRVSYPVPQVQEINTGTSGEHGRPFIYDYNKGIVYLGSEHSMHQDLYRELHRIQNFTRDEIKSLLIGAINDWEAFPSRNGWYFQHERLWSPEHEQAVREALAPYTTTEPEPGSDPPWLPDDQENPFESKLAYWGEWFHSWFYFPDKGLIIDPHKDVNHRQLIGNLGMRAKDLKERPKGSYIPGQIWMNDKGGEVLIASDYMTGNEIEFNDDPLSLLAQKAVGYVKEWFAEHYPGLPLIDKYGDTLIQGTPKTSAMAPMNVRWVGHPSRSSAIWCWHIPSNTLILAPWFSVYHSDIIRELEPNMKFKDAIKKFLLGNLNLNEDGSVEVTDRRDQPLANREVADAVGKAFMANREARISMHFQYLPESEAPFRDAGAPFVITHDDELIVGNENHVNHREMMQSLGRRSKDIQTAGILFPDGIYTVLHGAGAGSSDPGLDWILDELPDDWWETGYNLEPKSLPELDFDWYTD